MPIDAHLGEVGPFAAEQFLHVGTAVGLAAAEGVNVLGRGGHRTGRLLKRVKKINDSTDDLTGPEARRTKPAPTVGKGSVPRSPVLALSSVVEEKRGQAFAPSWRMDQTTGNAHIRNSLLVLNLTTKTRRVKKLPRHCLNLLRRLDSGPAMRSRSGQSLPAVGVRPNRRPILTRNRPLRFFLGRTWRSGTRAC